MKSTEITNGWYVFNSNPNGRYGARKERVYVFGQANDYVRGTEYFREEAREDEETYAVYPDPLVEGNTLRVPADVQRRRGNRSSQRYWLVGRYVEDYPTWDYAEDENGELIEGPDGDYVRVESVIPAHWEFALVRAVTIICTWQQHLDREAQMKAWRDERDAEIEAARKVRAAEHTALAESLTEFGLTLTDVLGKRDAKGFLAGDERAARSTVEWAITLARKVAEHTTTAVLTVHR